MKQRKGRLRKQAAKMREDIKKNKTSDTSRKTRKKAIKQLKDKFENFLNNIHLEL